MMLTFPRRGAALALPVVVSGIVGGFAGGFWVGDHQRAGLGGTAVDGQAVASVRSLLDRQGVPGKDSWRSTVVADGRDHWVVRTWTTGRPGPARPLPDPDYVHDVTLVPVADGGGVGFHIESRSEGRDSR